MLNPLLTLQVWCASSRNATADLSGGLRALGWIRGLRGGHNRPAPRTDYTNSLPSPWSSLRLRLQGSKRGEVGFAK